jgi:hypothetical protein
MSRPVNIVLDHDEEVAEWVFSKIGGQADRPGTYVAHGYVDKETGRLVAGMVYENFQGVGMSSEISIAAEEKCGWFDDQTRFEAAYMAFEVQKVKILRCKIAETNTACISICERYGFHLKHRIEKAHPTGDLLIYEMTREDAQQHLDKFKPEWFGLKEGQHYSEVEQEEVA